MAEVKINAASNGSGEEITGTDLNDPAFSFSRIFNDAAFSIILSQLPEGKIVEVNHSTEIMTGYTREEMLGKTTAEIGINPNKEQRAEILKQLNATGMARGIEIAMQKKNGDWMIHTVNCDIVTVGGSKYILNTTQDITEKKRAERALKSTIEKLETSNKELQELAKVVSHDLQEPLRKIQSFGARVAGVVESGTDSRIKDDLARMIDSAITMRGLVDGLLSYLHVTSVVDPFSKTDLGKVARNLVEEMKDEIASHDAELELGDLLTVDADPLQVNQLFHNLIDNALKFANPERRTKITITGRLTGENYEVSVKDNGIGFDQKYAEKLFAPFQRLFPKGTFAGTGIGLAVARKIMERHGGTISATGIPDTGATFVVSFPVIQSVMPKPGPDFSGHESGQGVDFTI